MSAALRILTCMLSGSDDAADVVRVLRHTCARSETDARILLLVALPDAQGEQMPGDVPLIRVLQSGVMSLNARADSRFDLLVLRRTWSAAARAYIGCENAAALCRIARDLLLHGKADAAFAAATVSPAAVKELLSGCSAVLFSDLSLSCTPDTPQRMLAALGASGSGFVRARVLDRREYPQSVLSRLYAAGFSLVPPGVSTPDDCPLLVSCDALDRAFSPDAPSAPAAEGCTFVRREPPLLSALLARFHRDCLFHPGLFSLLPLAQLLLLLAAAASGTPALAAAAVLLPEYRALRYPSRLPGALVRIALLPALAAVSLDALLARVTAKTRFRLRVPHPAMCPAGSVFLGALLFAAAFRGVHALPALLPVAILWLAAPYIHPALSRPTIARIPLSADELSRVRSEAESAYFSVCASAPDPAGIPLRMLGEVAGCMLRLIEPDEAARRAEALLARYLAESSPAASAAGQAAMLACAQYLREHMMDCDAALRPLPASIESLVLSSPLPQGDSRLGAFLRAARTEDASAFRAPFAADGVADPLDTLFLPLAPARDMPPHDITLPLTHPHAFVRLLESDEPCQKQEEAAVSPGRFLVAAAAALAHPFYALLLRSPVAAPYSALLFS